MYYWGIVNPDRTLYLITYSKILKKAFILLLVFLTSFQLSGGYALAATLASTTTKQSVAVPGETEV